LKNLERSIIQKFIKIPVTVQNLIKWQQTAQITDVQPLNNDALLISFRLYNHNSDKQLIETAFRKKQDRIIR
jgi:hypothetical protein